MKVEVPVKKGQQYAMQIDRLGHNAEGVGKIQGFTVFVPFALPTEEVELLITEVKKNYAKGEIINILKKSGDRVAPKCEVYEQCGGCQTQHLSYKAQLDVKRQKVIDAVERIGKIKGVPTHLTIGAENPWNYRNKAQTPVGKSRGEVVLGCYARGTHAIVDAKSCLIQHEANNQVVSEIRKIIDRLDISVYDEKTGEGTIRHVVGRVGARSGEVMAILITATKSLPRKDEIVAELRKNIPGLVSVIQNINPDNTNVVFGKQIVKLWGKSSIAEQLGEFTFHISARSFFQVNTAQAEVLYRKAVEYAALTGNETVIDAYCGAGAITLFLAERAKFVYGIEIVESAILDAKRNAELNHVKNVEFIAGDVPRVLPDLFQNGARPDVVVVDPPRCGCEKNVLKTFSEMKPNRIVYVSCNPASLARDIAILADYGYAAAQIQPVDMFSQTAHVESVALLKRVE